MGILNSKHEPVSLAFPVCVPERLTLSSSQAEGRRFDPGLPLQIRFLIVGWPVYGLPKKVVDGRERGVPVIGEACPVS